MTPRTRLTRRDIKDLQRILTRSLDLLYAGTNTPSGLQLDSDYLLVITTMETQILAWQHEWVNGYDSSCEYGPTDCF